MTKPSKQAIVDTIRHQLVEDLDRVLLKLKASNLSSYDFLQRSLQETDVSTDEFYQTKFKGFYGAGPMPKDRWDLFFSILESEKNRKNISFQRVFGRIFSETGCGRVEASFSSKIAATINPELPVLDSKVLESLSLRLPYQAMKPLERRMSKIADVYYCIRELSYVIRASREYENWRMRFDAAFPQFSHFTDVKKLDLFLWQNR